MIFKYKHTLREQAEEYCSYLFAAVHCIIKKLHHAFKLKAMVGDVGELARFERYNPASPPPFMQSYALPSKLEHEISQQKSAKHRRADSAFNFNIFGTST